jgi:hypothetical protein
MDVSEEEREKIPQNYFRLKEMSIWLRRWTDYISYVVGTLVSSGLS